MEFIYPEPGRIDFDRYARYVESIRDRLPKHVHAFASDPRFFNITSNSSLHDAWLESFTVREAASGQRHEIRRLEIQILLLGPFHDLRTRLHYTDVIGYSAFAPAKPGHPRYEHTAHGNLITHEVRLSDNGGLIHEILFERDATILIECADFRHSEEPIPSQQ